jgi:anti-sigma regulatory factor (Ser/Thr protein kinase)
MTSDEPPAQRGWRPQDEAAAPAVLDQCFDAGSLSALRASTQACAAQAGMPAERATDLVIALHELAANAVRHGAGSGRLRIWDHAGSLYCRVDDDGSADGPPGPIGAGSASQNLADRWPREPGHGLWLARQVADQLTLHADSRGTSAVITFNLSAIADPLGAAVNLRGQAAPWERRPGA